ncbi:MAG: peptide-binding protein [Candidatus Eremiobacteraeota bacterium]|nr:peptide-binding protein [Candidatus Eremiobacteraeota bacterium]
MFTIRKYKDEFSYYKSSLMSKLPVLVIIIILLFLCNCHSNSGKDLVDNTFRYAMKSDPRHLNPILASEMASITVNSFIFNPLVRYNENLEIIPDLAESREIKDGGRRIIFHLKKGVMWHDGTEFTADDVVYTFKKILDPKTNTFNAGLFKMNKNILWFKWEENIKFKAIDKYTVEARLPLPFAPFLNNLTLTPIAPKHLLEGEDINLTEFNRNPVGTGPFKFKEWKTSDRITLDANPDYFNGKPKLDRIEIRIVPSAEGARIALISGQVDMAGLSAEDLFVMSYLKEFPPDLRIEKWKNFTYFYFSFDLTNPLFADKNVRYAISYAVDKKNMAKSVLHGTGCPIYGPIPAASWAYTDDVEKFEYNPEKAKKLLDDAGWKIGKDGIREKNGKRLSFKVIYKNGSRASESACIQLQNYLAAVGIELKLQSLDFGALINSLYPGQYESVVFDWVEPFDPDIFVEWHSSQCGDVGMNFMSYKNREVDILLEKARTTLGREERKKLYYEIQRKIAADAPYLWLWNQESAVGVNKKVKGLSKPSPAGLLLYPEKVYK